MEEIRKRVGLSRNETRTIGSNLDPSKTKCHRRLLCFMIILTFLSMIQLSMHPSNAFLGYSGGSGIQESNLAALDRYSLLEGTRSRKLPNQVHVLFALSGNDTAFLSEFEVALKSVLLNAPLQSSLVIHIMADLDAYNALEAVLARTEVRTWKTRTPITITTYNVQPFMKHMESVLQKAMHQYSLNTLLNQHTVGTYFRLFAHEVLAKDIKHVLYIDTDVVVMANLDDLWKHVAPDPWFHMGASMCAGFIILNVQKLDLIWNYTATLDMAAWVAKLKHNPNDQLIIRVINYTKPELVEILPPEWDLHVADDLWRIHSSIVQNRPRVGMLHFNDGRLPGAFFDVHRFLTDPKYERSWGLVHYYERLPWTWARFIAESLIDQQGHMLQVQYGEKAPMEHVHQNQSNLSDDRQIVI